MKKPNVCEAKAGGTWCSIALATLAAFYFATSLYIASQRLFWFDEILTVHIAWQPHWESIWSALHHAADDHPPLYYIVVRTFSELFGRSEVPARLPSALSMVAGMLITFACARRLTDDLHGLIAVSVLACSLLPYYGHEARPYALCFMLAALALWVWTYTGSHPTWPTVLFGLTFFVGVAINYNFLLCLVPYALWEANHWKPWRVPSGRLTAGIIGAVVSSALLSPLIWSLVREPPQFPWFRPSLRALEAIPSRLFPLGFFLLMLIVIWIVLARAGERVGIVPPPMQSGESVGWLFLCIPLAGFALAEWKTKVFLPRFFIGALPGVAVAFSCWLWRHFRNTTAVPLGVFLLLMSVGVTEQIVAMRAPDDPLGQSGITRQYLDLEGRLYREGRVVTLFADPILYLEAEHYSRHPDQCILLLPPDFRQGPTYEAQRFVLRLSHFYPLRLLVPPYELRGDAHAIALIEPTPEISYALREAGFTLDVQFSKPLEVAYLK